MNGQPRVGKRPLCSKGESYVTNLGRVPAKIEARLRVVAEGQGRDLSDCILAAALKKASREEKRTAQLAGMDEMTRINEDLGLHEWKLDDGTR